MEEYTQLTLNDWMDMKNKLRQQLLNLKRGFVGIGYTLRRMEDTKAYEQEGYKSLSEFAKKEFGLEASTVSKFMAINRAYSLDGYSELLLPEFEDFNRSQLEEMLLLPDSDREMITPETKRADIRALKQFNKAEPAAGEADTIHQLVKAFFETNTGLVKEVRAVLGNLKAMKEVINPSGSRSYKKGLYFLLMHEEKVDVKKFGGTPESYSWQDFFDVMTDIYGLDLMEEQETTVEGIAPAKIEEMPVNTRKEESVEAEEHEPNDEPIDRDGDNTGEDGGDEAAVEDPQRDETGEPEAGEPSGTGDSGTADPGEETAAEEPARGEAEGKDDAGSPERRAEGKAGASEKKAEQSEEQDLQREMNPPEHVEAEVVLEEVMQKTQMLYLLQRAEDFVKMAQWELAEEKVQELLKEIRSRKNGGYVQE